MSVRPERGGRITSLKLRGEELLDQGIGVDDPHAEGFVEAGAWGWDEMVPNIEATGPLPDHGEAWRVPWEVLHTDASAVVMRARGLIVPWELERTITLAEVVRVRYVYRNAGSVQHPAFWCAHPLFRYEMGMGANIPDVPEGLSAKVHLPPASIEALPLRWRSGAAIEVRWDVRLLPYVSIWACNGDLGGYRQIAIEPAFGGYEGPGPDTAMLVPGGQLEWWLEVRAL
jgi:hypothetical protein